MLNYYAFDSQINTSTSPMVLKQYTRMFYTQKKKIYRRINMKIDLSFRDKMLKHTALHLHVSLKNYGSMQDNTVLH